MSGRDTPLVELCECCGLRPALVLRGKKSGPRVRLCPDCYEDDTAISEAAGPWPDELPSAPAP